MKVVVAMVKTRPVLSFVSSASNGTCSFLLEKCSNDGQNVTGPDRCRLFVQGWLSTLSPICQDDFNFLSQANLAGILGSSGPD